MSGLRIHRSAKLAVMLLVFGGDFEAAAQQPPDRAPRARRATPGQDRRIAMLPVPDTLPELDQPCSTYARNAVGDYHAMRRYPQCIVPDDARWQANFQNHYNFCVRSLAHPDERMREAKARDVHMVSCGVRSVY